MYINNSRIKELAFCPQRFAWKYLQHISETKRNHFELGTAIHEGCAKAASTNDTEGLRTALEYYKSSVRETSDYQTLEAALETDMRGYEELNEAVVAQGYLIAREQLQQLGAKIISTEHEFCEPIPGTEHNDITAHFLPHFLRNGILDVWRHPSYEEICSGIYNPHRDDEDETCPCYRPHYIVGRTDAIIQLEGSYYILDYKTYANSSSTYWSQYFLDLQPSVYVWLAKQALGLDIRGVVILGINKPSTNQVANWNKKKSSAQAKPMHEYMNGHVEIVPRSQEQLDHAIQIIISRANEIERRMLTADFPGALASTSCTAYNSKCQFFDTCMSGKSGWLDPELYQIRESTKHDYVQKAETDAT